MARGQSGSLFLSLYDSFIHYSTPVYPDANRNRLSYLAQMTVTDMLEMANLQRPATSLTWLPVHNAEYGVEAEYAAYASSFFE